MENGIPFALGKPIGPSEWVRITQSMIDRFGVVTLDPDPMHIDPDWAVKNSPFGGSIAFGFQTMSMLTHLLWNAMAGEIGSRASFQGSRLPRPVFQTPSHPGKSPPLGSTPIMRLLEPIPPHIPWFQYGMFLEAWARREEADFASLVGSG